MDPWVKSEWKHEDVRRFVAAGEDMWHHGRMEPSSTSVAEVAASACAASVVGGLEAVGAAGVAFVARWVRLGLHRLARRGGYTLLLKQSGALARPLRKKPKSMPGKSRICALH